jgi:hypothetical protein
MAGARHGMAWQGNGMACVNLPLMCILTAVFVFNQCLEQKCLHIGDKSLT